MDRRLKTFKGILVVLMALLLGYVAINTVAIDIYEELTASGSLSLSWTTAEKGTNSSSNAGPVGYMIYCWNAEIGKIEQIYVSDPATAQYEFGKLRSGTYQCAISAISNAGIPSTLSNVVTRTVP